VQTSKFFFNIQESMKILDEFKKFAVKGNVIDLAVGVMIGTAFNKIVTSLVDDIVMPPIALISGGIKFEDYKLILKPAVVDAQNRIISEAVALNYGRFIQTLFQFLIIAMAMFLAVKIINTLRERQQKKEQKAAQEVLTRQEQLLTEIRDALVKKRGVQK
jgi:large conductance mechanosensitive channel